ncbi:lysozyme [Uliginosibacterium sediminicola]|uniref:Lysozyme n=1 Tax=Uliginosibacterium sediminicola TaxID=2024550 RepID=A0ABU9YVZ6_9RHOO
MFEHLKRALATLLVAGGASAGAIYFARSMEGSELKAYPDPGMGWELPTICVGHTRGVRRGDTATPEQCDAYLKADLEEAAKPLANCIRRPLARDEFEALVDFNFNTGAACRSAPVAAINAGKSCDEIADAFYIKAPIQELCLVRDPDSKKCLKRAPNIYAGKPITDSKGRVLLAPGDPIRQYTTGSLKPLKGLIIRRFAEGEKYRSACKAADAEERKKP